MTPETAATSATPFVYLVAPDRHPDPDVSRHRHQAVQHATAYLTGQGQAVYSPNLVRRTWNAQYMPKPTDDCEAAVRAAVMAHCDRIAVLQLPGWQDCPLLKADLRTANDLKLVAEQLTCADPLVPNRWLPNLLPGVTSPGQKHEIGPGLLQVTTKSYQAVVKTAKGNLVFDLLRDTAPLVVDNFIYLAREQGFYQDNEFHIIIPDLMMQAGRPQDNGSGNPGYTLPVPTNVTQPYVRGTLAMHADSDKAIGSQWFVICGEQAQIPPRYPIFGHLADGADTLDALARSPGSGGDNPFRPAERVAIADIEIIESSAVRIEQYVEPPPEEPEAEAEPQPQPQQSGQRRGANKN